MFLDDDYQIHEEAYVAKFSALHGKITIGARSSIWDSAVIRADLAEVVIGEGSSIQDNATVHVDTDKPTHIGNFVTVGHNAVIHGAFIDDNTIIGMGAIVLNGARIGKNCIIGAGSVITENTIIPDNSMVLGIPGKVVKELDKRVALKIKENAQTYIRLAEEYRKKQN